MPTRFSPRTAVVTNFEVIKNCLIPETKHSYVLSGPPGLGVTTIGDSVRGYKRLIKMKANASGGYSRVEKDIDFRSSSLQFSAECSRGGIKYPMSRSYLGYYLSMPVVPGYQATVRAENSAKMSFISDVKRGYNSISGGVFLGELGKTLEMIRNPARGLKLGMQNWLDVVQKQQSRYCTARNRTKWRSTCIKRMNADLADLWLEKSFGWQPLISDTIGGAEALSRLINGETRYETVRGSGRDEEASVTTQSLPIAGLPAGVNLNEQIVIKRRSGVYYYGAVYAKATGPTLDNFTGLFGFKFEEFVPTVWNLLPYSFLSDYFVNIGDILEATFFDTSSLRWASKAIVSDSTETHTGFLSVKAETGWKGTGSPGSAVARNKSFVRSATIGSLIPTLEVSLPGSPAKWTNVAALFASAVGLQNRMRSPPG